MQRYVPVMGEIALSKEFAAYRDYSLHQAPRDPLARKIMAEAK